MSPYLQVARRARLGVPGAAACEQVTRVLKPRVVVIPGDDAS